MISPAVISSTFIIPDILENWPWSRVLSEHYNETKTESSAWVESFKPFSKKGLKAFRACDLALLSALAYSPREKSLVRLGCDLMDLFLIYDEYTDIEDRAGAQMVSDVVMDAFANPNKLRPQGEICVGAIAKDLWNRLRELVAPDAPCLQHFLQTWNMYTTAVVQEAEDRANPKLHTFDDYLRIRRDTSGSYLTLVLIEFGLDLPEDVYHHPILTSLRDMAVDLIAITNDVYSFAREKSRGLSHNSVEVVMFEHKLTLQEAMDWLGKCGKDIVQRFLANVGALPSWGPEIDEKVRFYIDGLGQWVRGADDWSFEGQRYFGSRGPEIRQSRVMTLLPPSIGYAEHPTQ